MSRLIDADALIEALDSFILDETTDVHGDTVREILERLPTIEERKTGTWEQDNPFTKPRCSECGEPCFGLHGFDYTLTPYCPNCGAAMRRNRNETD